ncbi:hypothetical protein [Lewinella sp. IMCC34191]|uniref:hypothetical protein n=1 Tax=Lewinella sp. IMCC34191 TaxID=2259172 RepID=UPI001300317D|nr:hypothetical protein [Lewinella sp. IMCC34191]
MKDSIIVKDSGKRMVAEDHLYTYDLTSISFSEQLRSADFVTKGFNSKNLPESVNQLIDHNEIFTSDVKRGLLPLNQHGYQVFEKWTVKLNFDAIVKDITRSTVTCRLLINAEDHAYEDRVFPSELFSAVNNLDIDSPIVIKIKSRPGSTRIDVFDGSGIVSLEQFAVVDNLEDLKGSNIDQPLNHEISL